MKQGMKDSMLILIALVFIAVFLIVGYRLIATEKPSPGLREQVPVLPPAPIPPPPSLSPAALDAVVAECQELCDGARNLAGKVAFCGAAINQTPGVFGFGPYAACGDKVPCFVAMSCQDLTGLACRDLLIANDWDAYVGLITDVGSDNATAGGGCALPSSGSEPDSWKAEFKYTYENVPEGT